jgi:trans-aconitate methyltransferase
MTYRADLPEDVRAHRDWLLSLAPVPDAGLWVDLGCGVGADALTVAARHPQVVLPEGNARVTGSTGDRRLDAWI